MSLFYPASFNGKYIKLGEEALLFSQNTFNEDIMFELVAELGNIKISINYRYFPVVARFDFLDVLKLRCPGTCVYFLPNNVLCIHHSPQLNLNYTYWWEERYNK
jgi:hypothetical protein